MSIRFQYTGEVKYLIETVRLNGFELDQALLHYEMLMQWTGAEKPAILYGLGRSADGAFRLAQEKEGAIGYLFFPFITDIPWASYCDKNRRGVFGPDQQAIMTPEEMRARFPDAFICVAATDFYKEIKADLIGIGVEESHICRYIPGRTKVYEDKQYFGEAFMPPQKERFYVDGGAYCLDSTKRFLRWNSGFSAEGILAFEPAPTNYEICCRELNALPLESNIKQNSEIINAGVSNQSAVMGFSASGSDESHFSESGELSVSLTSIDDVVGDRNVSLIKLDVEGFELSALQGAEKTIRRCHPRMAVCAYHKLEDLLELPKWILDLDMGYKIRLRMYSNEYLEIVLYAY